MFEKLFVETSDLASHKITPYAVEREDFPAHHVKRAHTPQILELVGCLVLLAWIDSGGYRPLGEVGSREE